MTDGASSGRVGVTPIARHAWTRAPRASSWPTWRAWRRKVLRFAALAAAILGLWSFARPACAEVQAGVQVTGGVGVLRAIGPGDAVGAVHLGGRGDVLFLRERESDMGLGPYLALGSEAFDQVALHAGLEWLVPVFASIPLVLGAGGGVWSGSPKGDAAPIVTSTAYFGSRSYNFHGSYSLALGAFAEVRYALDGSNAGTVVAGLAFDASFLLYPVVLVQSALSAHTSD